MIVEDISKQSILDMPWVRVLKTIHHSTAFYTLRQGKDLSAEQKTDLKPKTFGDE